MGGNLQWGLGLTKIGQSFFQLCQDPNKNRLGGFLGLIVAISITSRLTLTITFWVKDREWLLMISLTCYTTSWVLEGMIV